MNSIIKKNTYFLIVIIIIILLLLWFLLIYHGDYGTTLFFGIPISIGFLMGYIQCIKINDQSKIKQYLYIFFKIVLVLFVFSSILILLGIEGAICIIMAMPFIILPLFLAYLFGNYIGTLDLKKRLHSFVFLLFVSPTTYIYDSNVLPINGIVTTTLTIDTSCENIWEKLNSKIIFKEKPAYLFENGISYPKSIEYTNIDNYKSYKCITNNDSLGLEIISSIKNKKMQFKPRIQTIPMREISPYKNIDAKHLHDYFFVNYGIISLEKINDHQTKIIAQTAYQYHIAPKWYWEIWTNYIINDMQNYVLQSLKLEFHE